MLRVLEERTEPISYEFDFELRDNSFTETAAVNPTQYGILKISKGKVKCDELAGFYYMEMETEIVDVLAGSKLEEEDVLRNSKSYTAYPAIRMVLPDLHLVVDPRSGEIRSIGSNDGRVRGVVDFDFRTLGWAMDSEHQARDSVQKILQHRVEFTSSNPKEEYTNYRMNEDGIAIFRCISRDYFVDTKRDYWLTKAVLPALIPRSGGKERVSARTDIELEKVGERWVPNKVTVENFEPKGRSKQEYTFKWESYNKSIPHVYFTEQYISDRLKALVDAKTKRLAERASQDPSKPVVKE
jgi:hypothetical protein